MAKFVLIVFLSLIIANNALAQSSCLKLFHNNFFEKPLTYKRFIQLRPHAISLAKHYHRGQKINTREYSEHLREVEFLLFHFGFVPKESDLTRKLLLSAWLHAVIEESVMTPSQLQQQFGSDILKLVLSVTIKNDNKKPSSLESLRTKFLKIKSGPPYSLALMLAKKIANWTYKSNNNIPITENNLIEYRVMKGTLFEKNQDSRTQDLWALMDLLYDKQQPAKD